MTIVDSPLVVKENSSIRCLSCSWKCLIKEGREGYCGVRRNVRGRLDLTVYGKPSALHIDPIEKKPFFHFLPGSRALSMGTIGCNFKCSFCQNWELSQALRENVERFFYDLPPQNVAELVESYKVDVIAYTYNEPVIWWEYARDIANCLEEKGINVKHVFVSSGYETSEAWDELSKFLTAVNIDLKAFNESFYWKYTKTHLAFVKNSIKEAKEKGLWVEVTTLLIPGLNDSEEEVREAAKFLSSIDKEMPWHLTAFHPDYRMLDVPHTPYERLLKARKIALEEGLRYVYIGNISNPYESTYCPSCNSLLIKRSWYNVKVVNLNLEESRCNICGFKIKGVWKH